jgi:hypothetical protein
VENLNRKFQKLSNNLAQSFFHVNLYFKIFALSEEKDRKDHMCVHPVNDGRQNRPGKNSGLAGRFAQKIQQKRRSTTVVLLTSRLPAFILVKT